MKQSLIKDFNLPGYVKGKSFADASKAIEKKFKDRNDKASLDTKKELINRLRKAQEHVKMQMEAANPTQPDIMAQPQQMEMPNQGDGLPQNMMGQNQAMFGQLFGNTTRPPVQMVGGDLKAEGLTPLSGGAEITTEGMPDIMGGAATGMNIMGGAQDVLKAGQQIFGKPDVDMSGFTRGDTAGAKKNKTMGTIMGAGKLAKGIATMNPVDMVGGVASIAGSIIGGNKTIDAMQSANHNNTQMNAKNLRPYAMGGKLTNDYALGGGPDWRTLDFTKLGTVNLPNFKNDSSDLHNPQYTTVTPPKYSGPSDYELEMDKIDSTQKEFASIPNDIKNIDSYFNSKTDKRNKIASRKEAFNKIGGAINENAANALQYVPVVGELFNKVKPVTTPRGTRITGRTKLDRMDEAQMQNVIDDQNVFEGVKTASAGNLGSLMAGNLGANLNKDKAKSAAYAQAFGVNAGQQAQEVNLDRNADLANMAADERYLERSAKDQGAFNTAKDARRASIINSLGNIGKEETNKKLVKEMFGYSWNGKYWVDTKGKKVDPTTVSASIESLNKSKAAMFGGMLKK